MSSTKVEQEQLIIVFRHLHLFITANMETLGQLATEAVCDLANIDLTVIYGFVHVVFPVAMYMLNV